MAALRRPSYRHAVDWIARNDESADTGADEIATLISVVLVADLFGTTPEAVTRDVLKRRRVLAAESREELIAETIMS